jgi:peptide/nickel transport system permease protein
MADLLRMRRWPKSSLWGGGLLLAILMLCVLGPVITPHDPLTGDLSHRLEPPSMNYPLGTDRLGRCQLSRTIVATRISLGLAALAAGGVTLLSLFLASVSVLGGRWVDGLVRRLVNVFISFPPLVLALAVVGVMGPSAGAAVSAIAWTWWPSETRVARSLLRTARQREFIDAAWLASVSPLRIFVRHMLPQVGPALAVRFSLELGSVVLALSTLSFLGLGVQPPQPEWGVMLNEARPFVMTAPYLLLGPGLGLMLTVGACNLLAEGLRQRLDLREAQGW